MARTYHSQDLTPPPTVCAVLTPRAPGAIAVIGLAGPDTETILSRIVSRRSKPISPPRHATGRDESAEAAGWPKDRPILAQLRDGEEILDDVVVVRFDLHGRIMAEINTHGGIRLVERTIRLLERQGAVLLSSADFVGTCWRATPFEQECDQALQRTESRRLAAWLLAQRVLLPDFLDRTRQGRVTAEEAAAFRGRSRVAIRLLEGIEIALVGPPNSGKSTLANRLIGRPRILVSDLPGTTRDWVAETALLQGWPIRLVDTAGVRETGCELEREAIERGRRQAQRADMILRVLDAATVLSDGFPEEFASLQPSLGLVVLNKLDLLDDARRRSLARDRSRPADAVAVSALTGEGVDLLEERIATLLGLNLLHDDLPTAFLPQQVTAFHRVFRTGPAGRINSPEAAAPPADGSEP